MTITNGGGEYRKIEIVSLAEFRRQESERMQQFGGATGMRFDPKNLDLNAEEWTPDYELAKRLAKMNALIEDIKALRDLPRSLREYAIELHKQSIPEVVARALERFLELSTMPHDDKWQAAFDSVRGIVVDTTPPGTKQKLKLDAPPLVPTTEKDPPAGAALKLTHFNECDKASNKIWLIKDFLAKGETSGLFGPPGSGKSALETDIAVALGCGEDFRGFKTKHRVGGVYFAFERADLTKRRLHAYRIRDGLDDIPISVAGEIINLMRPDCVEIIGATIKAHEDHYGTECGYVILDTAAKGIAIAGGDEDKAKDVNRCLANLRRIHELHNLHLSLVGHTGKDESRGQRGSNAAPGDYDLHIQISGEDTKTATVIKANDQPCGPLLAYRMHKIVLGHNEDGDEIATWIVDREEVTVSTPSGQTKLSKNQATLFAILHDAKNGLTTEQWNDKAKEAGLGRNRRATLYDLRSSLLTQNLIYQNPTTGLWRVKHT